MNALLHPEHTFAEEKNFPRFATYQTLKRTPSVLTQEFEDSFELQAGKLVYPLNARLEKYFASSDSSLRFGAAQFCGFLHDTIAVEHLVVIPAVLALGHSRFQVPMDVIQELYKVVTDEGHHAAQALSFLSSIKSKVGMEIFENEENQTPLFVRRLRALRKNLHSHSERALFDIVCGVVTETRISIELGQFASNPDLMESVKATCRSHQSDEDIHASQFRAVGTWLWTQSDEPRKQLLAKLFAQVSIARSLPDVNRLGFYFSQATNLDRAESQRIVDSEYTPEILRNDMMIAVVPTLRFLKHLGVLDYAGARDVFDAAGVNTNA